MITGNELNRLYVHDNNQQLSADDWLTLISHPSIALKFLTSVLIPEQNCVLYWSGSPIAISGNVVTVKPFVARFSDYLVVSASDVTCEIPDDFMVDQCRVSIYCRAQWVACRNAKRLVIDDWSYKTRETMVAIAEQQSVSAYVSRSGYGANTYPGEIVGSIRVGGFECGPNGTSNVWYSAIKPITAYGHRREFDHPDGCVTAEKLALGIVDVFSPGIMQSFDMASAKEISDAIVTARGKCVSIAERMSAIDGYGVPRSDQIDAIIMDYVRNKLIGSGELVHPNPFVETDSGFEINMDAVADSGQAFFRNVIKDSDSSCVTGGDNTSGDYSPPFYPVLPEGYENDEIKLFASSKRVQFGSASAPLEINKGKTLGCNMVCNIGRDDEGGHVLVAYAQADFGSEGECVNGGSMNYLPVGIKKLGSDYQDTPPDDYEDDPWGDPSGPDVPPGEDNGFVAGTATVRAYNIPEMDASNKDAINKQILFSLQSENGNYFIGLYHRYLQPDWPRGDWWPVWRLEAGYAGHPEEWSIWDAHNLGDEATFKIEWDHGDVVVTNVNTGDIQRLSCPTNMVIQKICDSGDSERYGFHSDAVIDIVNDVEGVA